LKTDPLSTTYARAFIELAEEQKALEAVIPEVRLLGGLFREDRLLRTFIESPRISIGVKKGLIDRVFRGKLSDLTVNFLQLVVAKRRQAFLAGILSESEVLYDKAMGRVHVEATTAVPLSPGGQEGLVAALKRSLGKEVVLQNRVRPEILGGLIIREGDYVADSSVRTALARIENRMLAHKPGSELLHEN
jgi:F-type H+-transporting ATPase subunit delta